MFLLCFLPSGPLGSKNWPSSDFELPPPAPSLVAGKKYSLAVHRPRGKEQKTDILAVYCILRIYNSDGRVGAFPVDGIHFRDTRTAVYSDGVVCARCERHQSTRARQDYYRRRSWTQSVADCRSRPVWRRRRRPSREWFNYGCRARDRNSTRGAGRGRRSTVAARDVALVENHSGSAPECSLVGRLFLPGGAEEANIRPT